MERFGDLYLDLNQTETNLEDVNLNAVLVELDKGLQSENIGQQVESIVKFSELFDKFPLPVFVNSGFSRLGKVFQNGNNYLKLQVIRVIEKNQKHLAKILNVEELTNLLFYNIHSNDSTCRALTLRALAEISPIISDKHNVQHSIRLALESHDEAEAREAIYAANKFCALSTSFAASLFDRITEMIEDIQSPLNRKMKLVPLLVHMHHDTSLSAKAKNLCQVMYFSFPRSDISKIILNTLTKIACKSLTNVDETITFFIRLLHEEPRNKIQLYLLENLDVLANRVAHLWSNENVRSFIEYTSGLLKDKTRFLLKASEILCTLAKNSNIYFLFSFSNSLELNDDENGSETTRNNDVRLENEELEKLIEAMIFHENKPLAYNFCLLSTTLLVLHSKSSSSQSRTSNGEAGKKAHFMRHLFELTKNGLFAIILHYDKLIEDNTSESEKSNLTHHITYLKNSLMCTINLVKINDQAYFNELYSFICNLFNRLGLHTASFYCETLLTLSRYENVENIDVDPFYCRREQLEFIASTFSSLVEQQTALISNNSNQRRQMDSKLQLKCMNLLFELQIRRVNYLKDDEDEGEDVLAIEESVHRLLELNQQEQEGGVDSNNVWPIFQLARMCVRYTYYELAHEIYARLASMLVVAESANTSMSTSDLSYKCWFDFMSHTCRAEHLIRTTAHCAGVNELIAALNEALSNYMRAQVIFKSSCVRSLTSPYSSSTMMPSLETSNSCFQMRYAELRCEQIRLYTHVILSTMTCFTQPAPVFRFQSAAASDFARFGRVSQQLKYASVELQKLTQKYKDFIAECFDADQHTINILNMQVKEEFYANFLNLKSQSITTNKSNNTESTTTNFVEYSAELKLVENFYLSLLEKLTLLCIQDKETNGTKISQIKQFQKILIDFISMPIPLPRAFFTTLQKTQIKLIVNPNNKKTNTIPTIRSDQTLVVKIDGIITQQFKTKEPIRTVKKVQICLTTELDAKSIPDAKSVRYSDIRTSLEEPKNDYFNSNILITFPHYGTYTIQVDLYILDNTDVIWRYISEKHQIVVKVEDDPNRQRLFAAMVAAAANSSAAAASQVATSSQQSSLSSYMDVASSQERIMMET